MARKPVFTPPPGPAPDAADRLVRVNRRRGRILTLLVSVAALASFGGVIYWAHEQDLKSGGEGIVPLIRAEEGPAKVKPEQPGGMVVPNQDKTVYDRISPGSVPTGPEKLLPPPPTPVIPPATPPQTMPAAPADTAAAPAAGSSAPPPLPADQSMSTVAPPPTPVPAAPQPPAPAQPATNQDQAAPAAATAAAAPAATPVATPGTGKPEVLTPPAQGTAPAPQPASTPTPGQSIASLIDSISGHRIQLASVRSEDQAQATWARIKRGNEDVLGGLTMRAVRVDLGDRGIYYRVQAGPLDEAGAQSACAKLKSRSVDCIVVKP